MQWGVRKRTAEPSNLNFSSGIELQMSVDSKSLKPLELPFNIKKNRDNNFKKQLRKYFVSWKYYTEIQG